MESDFPANWVLMSSLPLVLCITSSSFSLCGFVHVCVCWTIFLNPFPVYLIFLSSPLFSVLCRIFLIPLADSNRALSRLSRCCWNPDDVVDLGWEDWQLSPGGATTAITRPTLHFLLNFERVTAKLRFVPEALEYGQTDISPNPNPPFLAVSTQNLSPHLLPRVLSLVHVGCGH